jgi:hypothetical protein
MNLELLELLAPEVPWVLNQSFRCTRYNSVFSISISGTILSELLPLGSSPTAGTNFFKELRWKHFVHRLISAY